MLASCSFRARQDLLKLAVEKALIDTLVTGFTLCLCEACLNHFVLLEKTIDQAFCARRGPGGRILGKKAQSGAHREAESTDAALQWSWSRRRWVIAVGLGQPLTL
jgi:hypothetical protein